MMVRTLAICLAVAALPGVSDGVHAQHGGTSVQQAPALPKEATQFDFLIGQWTLTVKPLPQTMAMRIHGVGNLAGTWKAWRAFDGWGIEDELRITDAAGNPVALSHTMRSFDGTAKHWTLSALDPYRAVFSSASGEWRDGQMTLTGRGTDSEGKAYITRSRFSELKPTAFRFSQERSYDDGKTWKEHGVRIDAKRVAAIAPR